MSNSIFFDSNIFFSILFLFEEYLKLVTLTGSILRSFTKVLKSILLEILISISSILSKKAD